MKIWYILILLMLWGCSEKKEIIQQNIKKHQNIGKFHHENGNYLEAQKSYLSMITEAKKIEDSSILATTYRKLGTLHYQHKNYEEAKKEIQIAITLSYAIEEYDEIANCNIILGNIFSDKKDYKNALKYFDRALKVKENLEEKKGIATCMMNIGNCYTNLQMPDFALKYYQKAEKILRTNKDYFQLNICIYNIGNWYYERDNLPKALKYLHEADSIARKYNFRHNLSSICQELSYVYYAQGKIKLAFDYLHESKSLNDSLFNDRLSEQRGQDRKTFEYEKEQEDKKRENERIMMTQFSIGSFLVLILLPLFTLLLGGLRMYKAFSLFVIVLFISIPEFLMLMAESYFDTMTTLDLRISLGIKYGVQMIIALGLWKLNSWENKAQEKIMKFFTENRFHLFLKSFWLKFLRLIKKKSSGYLKTCLSFGRVFFLTKKWRGRVTSPCLKDIVRCIYYHRGLISPRGLCEPIIRHPDFRVLARFPANSP